jgi:hypothetical protein
MALRTLGTKGTLQLASLSGWSQALLPSDVGAMGAAIVRDDIIPVLATATTAGTTALTIVTARVGSAPVSQIKVGDKVSGSAADITPGTHVAVVAGGGATLTLSQPTASTGANKAVSFLRQNGHSAIGFEGLLLIPGGRGVIKVLPGDIVAVDSTGWPILISAASIAYAGSDWTLT